MGKIKNQTQEQKVIHNRAVKIRKMTDEELVRHFDTAADISAEQLNTENNAAKADNAGIYSVKTFLHDLETADLRGIGKITIKKISEFAKEKGYI